jgi:hypothetical protein
MVYPRLLTVIADMLEKWELLCLYVSGASNRPCPACDDTKIAMALKVAKCLEGVLCNPSKYVYACNLYVALKVFVVYVLCMCSALWGEEHSCYSTTI